MAFVSISEAAELLERWAGVSVTARMLRYLGIRSRWALDGARLIGPEELSTLAIYVRLSEWFRRWELPLWKARAAVLYLEPQIRAALVRRRPVVLVVDPIRGTVQVQASAPAEAHTIAMRPLLAEMTALIASRREVEPEVWNGRAYVEEPELVEA